MEHDLIQMKTTSIDFIKYPIKMVMNIIYQIPNQMMKIILMNVQNVDVFLIVHINYINIYEKHILLSYKHYLTHVIHAIEHMLLKQSYIGIQNINAIIH